MYILFKIYAERYKIMIKIKKEKIFLTFAIFSIFLYGYYVKKNSNDASCFLKEFFLYTGSNIKISFNSILLYYTIHILVLFSFLPSSFLYSRNYRGLILHRYRKKTFFLKQALLQNLFNILLTMLWVSVPLITFLYVNNIYIKNSSIVSTFLLFINIVLYYHTCKVITKKSRPKWTALIISVIPRGRRAAAWGTAAARSYRTARCGRNGGAWCTRPFPARP